MMRSSQHRQRLD